MIICVLVPCSLQIKRIVKLMLHLSGENVEAVTMENQPLREKDIHNIDVILVNCQLTVKTVYARTIPRQGPTQIITPKRELQDPVMFVMELGIWNRDLQKPLELQLLTIQIAAVRLALQLEWQKPLTSFKKLSSLIASL